MGIAAVTGFIEFLHFYYVSYLFLNLFLSQNVFVIPADFQTCRENFAQQGAPWLLQHLTTCSILDILASFHFQ